MQSSMSSGQVFYARCGHGDGSSVSFQTNRTAPAHPFRIMHMNVHRRDFRLLSMNVLHLASQSEAPTQILLMHSSEVAAAGPGGAAAGVSVGKITIDGAFASSTALESALAYARSQHMIAAAECAVSGAAAIDDSVRATFAPRPPQF